MITALLHAILASAFLLGPLHGQIEGLSSEHSLAEDPPVVAPKLVAEFPYQDFGGLMMVNVSLDGSRPLRCLLDTGMPEGVFLVDPAVGAALKLEYLMQVPVTGSGGGSATADIAVGSSWELAGQRFDEQRVIVLTELSGTISGMGFDGAVGATVFQRFVVEIDTSTHTLRLFEPEAEPSEAQFAQAGATILPLDFEGTDPFVEAEVSIDGEPSARVRLLVDTGANGALMLDTRIIDGLQRPERTMETTIVGGVGGNVEGAIGRVDSLRLGEHTLRGLVARFPDSTTPAQQGTLGMEALGRFLVRFDYSRQRMILRPTERLGDRFHENMAGLGLRPLGSGFLRVSGVLPGSPAAEAGVRKGDVLRAVDGQSVTELGWSRTESLFRGAERVLTLLLERAGKTLELSVTLRALI